MNGEAPCRRLEWDSDFFGHRIARILPGRLDEAGMARALAWAQEHAIACLYFLADVDATDTHRAAEAHGFHLVDVRLTLKCESVGGAEPAPAVRPGRSEDLPMLIPTVRAAHTDSRFFADPHFARERCADLYETWLRRSFEGHADGVFVAEQDGRACGYMTCHLQEGGLGQIGLVGVAESARGRGLGRQLMRAALRWFDDHGCRNARVVTQGRNAAALRLYQGCGFRLEQIQLWFHWWRVDSPHGRAS